MSGTKFKKGSPGTETLSGILSWLMNQIKDEKQSKKETLRLFIDFEKAYDSVWKKGLAVKLWEKGVTGKFMNLLDGFMNNRETQLQVKRNEVPQPKMWGIRAPTRISDISNALQVLLT